MSHYAGDMLGGRYRLEDRIAVGGMGEVWRATDTVLRRAIALKTLRADRAVDPQFRSRFQHEARAMAALHHPGIADVYDFGQEPGDEAYLVMARINGQPLNERIAARGRLTAADTMSIVGQVAHALQAAHEAGIVHRDVKPGNIIVQPDGRAVLVDFGIARSARSERLTGAGEIVGTAHYLAPEQVSQRPVGPAADVYALGAVTYHCLAGHPPFLGASPVIVAVQHVSQEPPPLPEDLPPRVRALVATALAKDPAARFPSAAAMARAAEQAGVEPGDGLSGDTATLDTTWLGTAPTAPPLPPPAPNDRRWTMAALVLMVLALIAAGIALALADPFGRAPTAPATSATPAVTHTSAPASPATAGSRSPSLAPSTSPSPTTTTPEPTPTTTPPASTPPTTKSPTTTTPTTTTPTTKSPTTGPPPTTPRNP